MGKWKRTVMIMAITCIIAGCGRVNASSSDMDTISVMKDGKIVQTIVDHFDQNYYDVDELSAMTNEKIELYSDADGDIVCESVEEKDDMIVVKIAYKTSEDYTDFNGGEFFFGTVKEALEAGYSVKDMVLDDGQALSDTQLKQIENNHVVIIQAEAENELGINVYDKILYISADAVLSGKKDVIIGTGEKNKLSCIVFK